MILNWGIWVAGGDSGLPQLCSVWTHVPSGYWITSSTKPDFDRFCCSQQSAILINLSSNCCWLPGCSYSSPIYWSVVARCQGVPALSLRLFSEDRQVGQPAGSLLLLQSVSSLPYLFLSFCCISPHSSFGSLNPSLSRFCYFFSHSWFFPSSNYLPHSLHLIHRALWTFPCRDEGESRSHADTRCFLNTW